MLLAHLSRRLIGELIGYSWSGVRRPSVRPSSVVNNFKHLLLQNRLLDQAFLWEKVKTVDFSETIAASDLKVGRSSHLIEYMKVCGYKRSRSFLDLGPRSCTYKKIKQDFLRNYFADLNNIFYESFQVQGNENLMT